MNRGLRGMLLLACALAMGIAAECQVQTEVAGDWHGSLHTAGGELHLVLHITRGQDGSLGATLDSVDQNANGIPVTKITLKGSELK